MPITFRDLATNAAWPVGHRHAGSALRARLVGLTANLAALELGAPRAGDPVVADARKTGSTDIPRGAGLTDAGSCHRGRGRRRWRLHRRPGGVKLCGCVILLRRWRSARLWPSHRRGLTRSGARSYRRRGRMTRQQEHEDQGPREHARVSHRYRSHASRYLISCRIGPGLCYRPYMGRKRHR